MIVPSTTARRSYRLGPFVIDSMVPLDLLPVPATLASPEIVVEYHDGGSRTGAAPGTTRLGTTRPGITRLDNSLWWHHLPGMADIEHRLVDGRGYIRVWPSVGMSPTAIGRLVLAGPLPALCRRMGTLPIRAASVLLGDRALILAGAPGTGKSALAAALVARGARLVADDLLFVRPQASPGAVQVLPGLRPVLLWPDIIAATGLAGPGTPLRPGVDKRLVDCATAPDGGWPASAVLFLRVGREASPALRPVTAATAARKLMDLARDRFTVGGSGAEAALLTTAALLATGVPAHELRRTSRVDDLPALAALVEDPGYMGASMPTGRTAGA